MGDESRTGTYARPLAEQEKTMKYTVETPKSVDEAVANFRSRSAGTQVRRPAHP